MSAIRQTEPLDFGVVIERVRVCPAARPGGPVRPTDHSRARAETGRASDRGLGDHRIIVRELRIEIDRRLGDVAERRLGGEVAGDLARRLDELQRRRLDGIVSGAHAGGLIRVASLCVRLKGDEARAPGAGRIGRALLGALEGRGLL